MIKQHAMKSFLILFSTLFLYGGCATISFMKEKNTSHSRARLPTVHADLQRGVWVIAHRGASEEAPENTFSAFDRALTHKVHMIEFDVMLSKDLVPVIFHDTTLDRTSTGKGPLVEKTWAQLSQLDVGSWKSPQFKNEKMPLLDDVLKKYGGKVALNIEIKTECVDAPGMNPKKVAALIMDIVGRHQLKKEVIVSSFNHEIIDAIRAIDKTVPLAYLTDGSISFTPDALRERDIDAWNPGVDDVTEQAVADFRSRGISVFVWGTNETPMMKRVVSFGVSGMFVDSPERLFEVLQK